MESDITEGIKKYDTILFGEAIKNKNLEEIEWYMNETHKTSTSTKTNKTYHNLLETRIGKLTILDDDDYNYLLENELIDPKKVSIDNIKRSRSEKMKLLIENIKGIIKRLSNGEDHYIENDMYEDYERDEKILKDYFAQINEKDKKEIIESNKLGLTNLQYSILIKLEIIDKTRTEFKEEFNIMMRDFDSYLISGHGALVKNEYFMVPKNVHIIFSRSSSTNVSLTFDLIKNVHGVLPFFDDSRKLKDIYSTGIEYGIFKMYKPYNFIQNNFIDFDLKWEDSMWFYSGVKNKENYDRDITDKEKKDDNINIHSIKKNKKISLTDYSPEELSKNGQQIIEEILENEKQNDKEIIESIFMKYNDDNVYPKRYNPNTTLLDIVRTINEKKIDKNIILLVDACRPRYDDLNANDVPTCSYLIDSKPGEYSELERVTSFSRNRFHKDNTLSLDIDTYIEYLKYSGQIFPKMNKAIKNYGTLTLEEICDYEKRLVDWKLRVFESKYKKYNSSNKKDYFNLYIKYKRKYLNLKNS